MRGSSIGFKKRFSTSLDCPYRRASCVWPYFYFILFFFVRKAFCGCSGFSSGSYVLFTGLTYFFFNKTFIKNGSHCTIYTFKNYFVIVF